MMHTISQYNPEKFEYVPPSFIFPQDSTRFEEYNNSHPNTTYIAKPKEGCQGEGI